MRRLRLWVLICLASAAHLSSPADAQSVGLDEYRSLCHESATFDEHIARANKLGWSSAEQNFVAMLDHVLIEKPQRSVFLKKPGLGGGLVLARITEGKPRDLLSRKQVECFVRIVASEGRPDLRQGFYNLMKRRPTDTGTGKGGTTDYWMNIPKMRANLFWNEPMDDGRHIMTFLGVDM